MSIKDSLNRLNKSISADSKDVDTIQKSLKEFIAAIGEGEKVTVNDDTLVELLNIIADVLPGKIGGGGGESEASLKRLIARTAGTVTIPTGVTTIGDHAFADYMGLSDVIFPDGITSIGNYAFSGCGNLIINELPSGVTTIGENAFAGSGVAIEVLPSSLTTIGNCAFGYCNNFEAIEIPSSVTTIDEAAFYECFSLAIVNFKGTPNSIGSDAFAGCENLETINVPWAEGAVEGAPWGAGNATINYNHT